MPRKRSAKDAYAEAGVDIRKVRAIQGSLATLFTPTFKTRKGKFGEPAMGIGHYAGLVDIGNGKLLTLHTDGVGTKVLLAQEMGEFDTVGIDCVGMTVNDLICLGSEPIALLDYIALEKEDHDLVAELSKGLVAGAAEAGAAIVGGETAILGDVIKGVGGRGFDLVSMGAGVVERSKVVDGTAISEGDSVVGVSSSGLHSNGYTLARRLVKGLGLDKGVAELGTSVGEALLAPTRIYVKPTLRALNGSDVHGIAHVTGGAFTKLTRLTGSRGLLFSLDRMPKPPPLFHLLARLGHLSTVEMYRTFNMGVGLCVVVPPSETDAVIRCYERVGFDAWKVGSIKKGEGVTVGKIRVA